MCNFVLRDDLKVILLFVFMLSLGFRAQLGKIQILKVPTDGKLVSSNWQKINYILKYIITFKFVVSQIFI